MSQIPSSHATSTEFGYSAFSVNVIEGEAIDRQMTTGNHTVRDIYCCKCGTTLGWKYVRMIRTSSFVQTLTRDIRFRTTRMNLHRSIRRENTSSKETSFATFNEATCLASRCSPRITGHIHTSASAFRLSSKHRLSRTRIPLSCGWHAGYWLTLTLRNCLLESVQPVCHYNRGGGCGSGDIRVA